MTAMLTSQFQSSLFTLIYGLSLTLVYYSLLFMTFIVCQTIAYQLPKQMMHSTGCMSSLSVILFLLVIFTLTNKNNSTHHTNHLKRIKTCHQRIFCCSQITIQTVLDGLITSFLDLLMQKKQAIFAMLSEQLTKLSVLQIQVFLLSSVCSERYFLFKQMTEGLIYKLEISFTAGLPEAECNEDLYTSELSHSSVPVYI